jgi:hypothetical protein
VVGHHILELSQDDRSHEARQRIVQRVPVDLECTALATLTLVENNSIPVTSKSCAQFRPTAARNGRILGRESQLATQETNQRLQFLQGLSAIMQMRQHHHPQSRPADMLRADPQSLLGIATSSNQLIQCVYGETMTHGSGLVVRWVRTRKAVIEAGDVPK